MGLNNFLKGVILSGLFLVPFVPFFISGSLLFPFITGKAFAFRIIVEIIFVAWLILALRDTSFRPHFSWILGTFSIFLVVVALADMFGASPFKSFWSNFERMEGFITILHLFAYFVVLSGTLIKESYWKNLLTVHVGASAIMGIYGLFQLSGKININQGGVRLDGTLGNASYLAVFMMMNIFFAIFLFVRSQNKKNALWWFAPLILLQTYILYHTATRGAILGLLGGLIVSALLLSWRERENKAVRKTALAVLAVVVLLVGGFYLIRNSDFVKENPVLARFNLSPSEIKSQGRYYIWPMAWQGIKERPVLGWGQENFSYIFNKHYNPKLYAQEQWFDRAHSTPLDWFVAGGFLGFASYLSLFVFALWYLWRRDPEMTFAEKSVLTGLLCAYFFQNIFVFDNLVSYILFFTALAYIHFRSSAPEPMFPKVSVGAQGANFISAILILLLGSTIYYANIKPILAGQTLIDALRTLSAPAPEGRGEALVLFKKALAYNTLGNSEVREHMANSAGSYFIESVPLEIRQEYFDLTRGELLKQLEKTPNDARFHVFLGMFLSRAGLYDDAISALTKAHELSPGKQVILFDIAGAHLAKGETAEALQILKTASELEPSYNGAQVLYAIGALYAGEITLAKEIMSTIPEEVLITDTRLIETLVELKQYDILLPIFVARLERAPEEVNNYLSLAALLFEVGDREKSIEVLEALREVEPSLSEEVDSYISDIRAGRRP